jgi:SAM-dependent methyltransferase
MTDRRKARELCADSLRRGDGVGWFETLYAQAAGDAAQIPWADLVPNPHLVEWRRRTGFALAGKSCLKIGCGLGDDAEYLAAQGGRVTAFDVSPTAIDWCRRRFPQSLASYCVADVLAPPAEWSGAFDFVQESYTLQVLPPDLRAEATRRIAACVAQGGMLLVIARFREDAEPAGRMPWPLTRGEVLSFQDAGLALGSEESFLDNEDPPVRRVRATFTKP